MPTHSLRLPSVRRRPRIDPLIEEARDRQRRRRFGLAIALLLLIVAVAAYRHFSPQGSGGSPPATASTVTPQPAGLPEANGWHGGVARIPNSSCPRCLQIDSWAATVPYRDAPNDFPHKTMAVLGPDDAIILLIRSWQPHEPAWALQRHPLRVAPSQIQSSFEGNTTHGRVSLWLATTWRGGSNVEAYVYFGSPKPSARARQRVQAELDATTFPVWHIRR